MKIPNILNDANVYVDGANWLGKAEVKLPDIKSKMQGYRAFGFAGETDMPVMGHVDKLDGSIKFKVFVKEAASILFNPSKAPLLDIRASVQTYDPSTGETKTVTHKVTMRAFFKDVKFFDLKPASDTENEVNYIAHYLKYEIDGEEVLEIDQFNYIYKINGEDILAQVRENLGM